MSDALIKRRPYQAEYRSNLEEPANSPDEPTNQDADLSNTSTADPGLSPEENTWKKRYGDLRSHQQKLTDEVKSLKAQLLAAQKQEIQIPSTAAEIQGFAQRYPDVYRHIRSIAMQEILSQKADLEQETKAVQEDLESFKRQASEAKIRKAHSDFDELNASKEFHEWAGQQSRTIQKMIYESTDPDDCIAALDLFKAQNRKKPGPKPRSNGADTLVTSSRQTTDVTDEGGKKIWKESEIGKMHSKVYEKFEAEIDQARLEGRVVPG